MEIVESEAFEALRSLNFEEGPFGDRSSPVRRPSGLNLFRLLGLYVRDREDLDHEGLRRLGFAYDPTFLEDFEEVNRGLTERSGEFRQLARTGLAFAQYDPAEFLAAHIEPAASGRDGGLDR